MKISNINNNNNDCSKVKINYLLFSSHDFKGQTRCPYVWWPIAQSLASSAALKSSQNCPGCSQSKQKRSKHKDPCRLPTENERFN